MIDHYSYGAGGYDWLEVWRRMYTTEREQGEAIKPPDTPRPADHWQHRAARFAEVHRRQPQPDEFMQWLLPRLHPDDTVLDVGAGTGRYVPTLARHVARVIAVEPSDAMREHLEQRIAEEQLANVQVIGTAWPPEEPVQADVVMSAHVVYGVAEIGPFLHAMHTATRRLCVLSLAIRHFNIQFAHFWERIHGEPRLPLPTALEAYNVLFQLGYPATMERIAARYFTYANRDEALEDIRQRLRLAPEPHNDARLHTAIDELLVCHDDGSLTHRDQPRYAAVIWWEKIGVP